MSLRRRAQAASDVVDSADAAFDALARDLGRRDHTEASARQRLRERGFSRPAIDAAIARAVERRYLDDARVAARMFAALRDKGWGPAQARLRLQQQGVGEANIEALLDDTPAEVWVERARGRLSRKGLLPTADAPLDEDARGKAWRYLQYRGFSSATIRAALSDVS
jgi:regulatory protein